MNKKISKYEDEIDISDFFKLVWKGRKTIFLVVILSFILGIGYAYKNNLKPQEYEVSIYLSPSEKSQFVKFININKILISKDFKDHLITNEIVFKNFINNIRNFDSNLNVFKKNIYIKKMIDNLPQASREITLYKYIRLLTVEKKNNDEINKYVLKFNWHDSDEAISIINDILESALLNIKNSIFKNLDDIQKVMERYNIEQKNNRITFLENQILIANELNIDENKFNLNTLRENGDEILEYLRGSKALNKEISIIKNRKDSDQIFLSNEIKTLKNLEEIDLVKFNLLDVNIIKIKRNNYLKIFLIAISLGFIFGIILVKVRNFFKFSKKIQY